MESPKTPWYFTRTFVLILLATTGPVGFPFLWLSPRFNPLWKIALTLLVIFPTIAFIRFYPSLERELNREVAILREAFPELRPVLPQ